MVSMVNALRDSKQTLLITLGALFLTAQLIPVLRVFPNAVIDDDGYFYAQVGYNLGERSQSSFDGIHTTSGYHLLWGLTLGGISKVVSVLTPSKDVHLAAFFFAGVWLCGMVAVRAFSGAVVQAAAFSLLLFGYSLMETVLLAAVLVAVVSRAVKPGRVFGASPTDLALMAMVPLVRIDALPLALVLACGLGRDWRSAGRVAAAVLGGALINISLMWLVFGDPFPVSAVIKVSAMIQGLPQAASNLADRLRFNISASKAQMLRFGLVWLLAGLAWWLSRGVMDREQRRRRLWILVAVMAFYLPHLVLTRVRAWYYPPIHAVLWLMVTYDAAARVRWRDAVRALGVAVMVLYVAGIAYVNVTYRDDQIRVAGFVARLGEYVPAGGRIFTVDGSGYPGFFATRTIINGDGLANDATYAARLRGGRLAGYLEEERLCFVMTNERLRDDVLVNIGGLKLVRDQADLIASTDAEAVSRFSHWQLFRLRRPGCEPSPR